MKPRCLICGWKVKPGPNGVSWRGKPAHKTCLDKAVLDATLKEI